MGTGTAIGGNSPKPRIVVSGDFNGDTYADIAWTIDYDVVSIPGNIGIALNNRTNDPFNGVTSQFIPVGVNPYGLIATDVNQDGKTDLVAANSPTLSSPTGTGTISVLLGNGNGTFQSALTTAVGNHPRYLAAGDFNRDGYQDLALSQSDPDNNISLLFGNGTGAFSRTTLPLNSVSPRDLISADFNGDGFLDLAAATYIGDNIYLFLGHGDGSFSTARAFAVGDGPVFMTSTDFNHDGHPDLAVANYGADTGGGSSVTLLSNRTTFPQRNADGSPSNTSTKKLDIDSTPDDSTPADNAPPGVLIQARDSDGDGLREAIRDAQGNLVDGNRDGVADAEQANVTALHMLNDGSSSSDYGAISVSPDLQLRGARLTAHDAAAALSHSGGITNALTGVVSFSVSGLTPGGHTQATVHLPSGLPTGATNAYLRFNYSTNRYEEYVDASGTPLYAFSDSNGDGIADAITLTLVDGDPRWDGDGLANGTVVDPGFPAAGERNLTGSRNRDALTGNLLANTMVGKGRNDRLSGGLGNDILKGRRGNDHLYGGDGADTIIGGRGRDHVLYIEASESSLEQSDNVTVGRGDRFDFRRFDADATTAGQQRLSWIGNTAFSGRAGELRATRSRLEADLNGDGSADFAIHLHGHSSLNSRQLLV